MTKRARSLLDPGLQAERTALAWRRTALSMGVAGLAGLRWATHVSSTRVALAGCVALICAGVVSALSARRYQRSWDLWASDADIEARPPGARTIAACSLLLFTAGIASAVAVVRS